jgi:RHS repeat-associated protein
VNWAYNQNNELQNYDGVTFQYDLNGNIINKTNGTNPTNETIYVYDIENRLIRVEDGTGKVIAKYEYDPFGRRLWKEVDGTKQYFIYCDEGLAGELDQNGSLTKAYGWKPNSTWTTNPLFMREGESYYYYHNDHLGTPQKLTAQNGAVVWSAKYTAFGEAEIDPSSTITNNLRFPGQYQDDETGLHYNYHRYYDPRSGRYITPDPIGLLGGVNLFAYVGNNPSNNHDSFGLWQYQAFCRYISASTEGIGAGVLKCHIAGPCMRNNKRRVWMTKTELAGFSAGSPGGLNYFSMTLDDNDWSSNYPDGSKLLGFSHVIMAGWAIPGYGKSYSDIKLGSASYQGIGDQTGIDLSVDIFWGVTTWNDDIPQYTWLEDCCYGQD